jgi:SAM-dependent methyltransferase
VPPVHLPYVDSALAHLDGGGPASWWHHLHWGLYDDPATGDDSPEGYVEAATNLTERVVAAAGIADGRTVLDVGCGFGGTLAHIAGRNRGCRLAGLNIDERQLAWARRLLGPAPPLVAGDGCFLPVAPGSLDHVLAVECVFHFASRKGFFREAARVLRLGATLALSDFVLAPGGLAAFLAQTAELGPGDWYGRSSAPLTSAAYERLGRATGFDLLDDDDITARTLPTYRARRRHPRPGRAAGHPRGVGVPRPGLPAAAVSERSE